MKRMQWAAALVLSALVAVVLVRFITMLRYPFGVDQGVFAWLGTVIADGGRPYLDAWDTKGPGVFAIAGVLASVAPGIAGQRAFDLLLQLIAAAMLHRHALSAAPPMLRLVAPLAYLGGYALLGFHETAQPDSWCSALIVIGFLPAYAALGRAGRDGVPLGPLVGAGIAVGLTSTIKPTYAVLGAAPLLIALTATMGKGWGPRIRALLALLMGIALPVAVCLAWLAARGALQGAWDVVVLWNSQVYVGAATPPRLLVYRMVTGFLGSVPWAPIAMLALLLSALRWREPRVRLILAWAVMALLEITAQQKFWVYQWTPLLGPVAVLLGKGTAAFEQLLSRRAAREPSPAGSSPAVVSGVFLLLLVPLAGRALAEREALTAAVPSEWAPVGYRARLDGIEEVAAIARATTADSDRVLFFGTLATGNFLARRPAMGRLGLARPLLDGEGTAIRARYRQEFWRQWSIRPPAVVVTYDEGHCARTPEIQWMCRRSYDELMRRLAAEYGAPQRVGVFEVFRRRGA